MNLRILTKLLAISMLTTVPGLARSQELPILNDGSSVNDAMVRNLPKFDVVSVKEDKGNPNSMGMQFTADGFIGRNLKVRDLICLAYGVRRDQISGAPNWVSATGYDVDAKVSEHDLSRLKALSPNQRRMMLQAVLVERFGLKAHREVKVMKTFDLVQSGSPVKLRPSSPQTEREIAAASPDSPGSGTTLTLGRNELSGIGLSMSVLANQISLIVERPVIDKTGLSGHFDLSLHWSPDGAQADDGQSTTSAENEPIMSAIRDQLGLKLISSSDPVPILTVDSIAPPNPN